MSLPFLGSIQRSWHNTKTSPTTPCAPLVSVPDQLSFSPHLARCWMPLVLLKLAGKCINKIRLARAIVVEPKPMATLRTSHTSAYDPLTPRLGQPTPSPCLRDYWQGFVLPKSAWKSLITQQSDRAFFDEHQRNHEKSRNGSYRRL